MEDKLYCSFTDEEGTYYCLTNGAMSTISPEGDDVTTYSFNFESGFEVEIMPKEKERKEYMNSRREKIAQFNEHRRTSNRCCLKQFFDTVRGRIKF